jgi:beta-hydroxyacyl-ACP dehydratase FabZ
VSEVPGPPTGEVAVLVGVQSTLSTPATVSLARAMSHFGEHAAGWVVLSVAGALLVPGRRREWLLVGVGSVAAHAETRPAMDIPQIMEVLPHRYPFLLVDRVVEFEEGVRAVGIKNVSINEHFFQGHYPGTPIMPGVLIVEAMAQLAGVLLLRKLQHTGQVAVLLSMDRVKLRKTVHPGDQLRLEAEVVRAKERRAEVVTRAWVGDEVAAEAKIRFVLIPADQEL